MTPKVFFFNITYDLFYRGDKYAGHVSAFKALSGELQGVELIAQLRCHVDRLLSESLACAAEELGLSKDALDFSDCQNVSKTISRLD